MPRPRRSLRWLAVVLLAAARVASAVEEPARESVASEASLPIEAVTALLEDRAGFLWVGSREGLVLYDGYTSATFEHDVADPSSLSDNAIRVLYEDRQGRLWIGTNTGGLNALDRATWRFRSFRHDSKSKDSISNDSVYAIAEDSGGRLWVGTQSGLDRFDPATGVFEHVQGLSDSYVDALFAAPDGTLFIGTVGGGLDRLDPATGSITVYRHDPKDEGTLRSDGIFALAGDPSGALYVASSIGVDRFDPSSGRAAGVPFAGVGKGEREHLVTSLARSDDGTLWAGTFESGLFAFLRGGDAFAPAAAGVAPRVTCLLADRAGRVWAGTWGGGLVRVAHGSGRFGSVNMGAPGGALVETTAVLEDRSGNLWSGESPSLAKRDPSGRTTRWPALGGAVALSEGPLGRLFVGTPFDCVELDPQAGAVRWRANPNRPRDAPVGPGWIWSVLEDREGQVWIGTGGGGLFRRRADGAYDRFRHDPADARSLSDDYVVALLESRDGALWVGTRSGGLNVLLRGGTAFTRFEPVAADPRSLSHHSVLTLLEDARGTLWAGTGGGGLDRVDRDPAGKVAFTRFTEQDGLIDDNIVSLAEDDDGSLWIGTRRGLSRFDPGSGRFASFGAEDGLPSVEFANGAASRGRHALYFGTHRGIVSVARGAPFPPALPSPAVVTSVRTLSGAVLGARPPWGDGRIEIPYGESLTFEMAVLDYGDRRRHRYAYRLDGLSSSWVDLGTRREVTLTHLDPGAYVLHVKGRNDQGMWSEAPVALRIRVIPPFWMTAWFRALCAAAVVAAAFMVHRVRTATLTRRNRQLMVLQEQRERALDEVGASQQALGQAYARLRGLTRRLEAAKEDERKRIARELHDEMGQILTTAKLNLQLVSGTAEPAERERRIGDSIGLIDRLIGHVRALSLALRPPLLDELGLAAALRGYVEAQARHSGLTITLAASPGPAELPADVEIAAFRVVQESVTNVLRHAEAKHVTVELRYDPRWILLLVTDDGHGFDVAAVERASDGRHLGLLGMKERVESMGGTIQIASTPAGSTVEVRLPWER